MGISIRLHISKSVTKEEWSKVYEESLILVKKFHLAEKGTEVIHGINTLCLIPTVEREELYGWPERKTRLSWTAIGDYMTLKNAEEYFLPRDLETVMKFEKDAGDAVLSSLPQCLPLKWDDKICSHAKNLWWGKTQGEPYHIFLLAIACLIESRLGWKVFINGDITRGQCRKAVRIANEYLENPIDLPDRCYADKWFARVDKLTLNAKDKFLVFNEFYLGTKDEEFGNCIRKNYSAQVINAYWKKKFGECEIGSHGFRSNLKEYMLSGFSLEKLCGYVELQNNKGENCCETFINSIMDAKMHHKEKNCTDPLRINQEDERCYGVFFLFAQFAYGGAKNNKIDRYIPIEKIKSALQKGLGDKCNVEHIIDVYLQQEAEQEKVSLEKAELSEANWKQAVDQDAAELFDQIYEKKQQEAEKYDISDESSLLAYREGYSIKPNIEEAIGKSRLFLDSLLKEPTFANLMTQNAHARCEWLANHNNYFLLSDQNWEIIYTDIEENTNAFGRYYALFRVKIQGEELLYMCIALLLNNDLFAYSKVLAAKQSEVAKE